MINEKYFRSCLRWPGNKYSLLPQLLPIINSARINNYHEPFLGSGCVYLNIFPEEKVFLSDSNGELINFYFQVKNNLPKLIKLINTKLNTEEGFYIERSTIYKNKIEKAAQFYFLNRTCYNGIYRVNSQGKFNVPYGKRNNLIVVDKASLLYLRKKLKNVKLTTCDFVDTGKNILPQDLVYFDPPYSSNTNSKSFRMYNEKLFSWQDQMRLKDFCEILISKGVNIIVNNLYSEEVYNLFCEQLKLNCKVTERYSGVGSQLNSRGIIKEYIFTNLQI